MEQKHSDLVVYLKSVMEERDLSVRAFAMYSGLTHTTLNRLLAGGTPDHVTLGKLADYLRIAVEDLYRLAGLIPDDDKRGRVESVITDLYGKLPSEDQAEIIEIIKLKLGRHRKS